MMALIDLRLPTFRREYVFKIPLNQIGQGMLLGLDGLKMTALSNGRFSCLRPQLRIGAPLKGCRFRWEAFNPNFQESTPYNDSKPL